MLVSDSNIYTRQFNYDRVLGTDVTTDSTGTPSSWYLNGTNGVYGENQFALVAGFTNVGNMLTATNWAISTSTATACPAAPTAPTGLTATVASATQIDLSWTDNSSDETGFKVESPAGTAITTTAANATTYSYTGLTCNTNYTFAVKATNANGDSSSITANATTSACTGGGSGGSGGTVSAPIFSLKDKPVIFSEEVK
jgi:hypothetical protein